MAKTNEINKIITDKILAALDAGIVAWNKPWRCIGAGAPINVSSKKNYRGVNIILLGIEYQVKSYSSNQWLTYKQARTLGGNVKKGQKSTQIYFWNIKKKMVTDKVTGEKVEKSNGAFLKHYNVFNIDQCEGIEALSSDIIDFEYSEDAEKVISDYLNRSGVTTDLTKTSAYYNKKIDLVATPPKNSFISETGFYATMFHELAHSTGHKSRLDRFDDMKNAAFGSCDYGKEELVAEFTAAFLCGHTNIDNIDQNAAYIDSWKKALKNDDSLVMQAVGRAQKAFDFIVA